ncbi:MAG: lysylphosphatidylglycerol synthase transmembrane domain-containing protein [Anaerovoracaceae bacterium]|jgi:uncharacterized protein (TIRG00374 family)
MVNLISGKKLFIWACVLAGTLAAVACIIARNCDPAVLRRDLLAADLRYLAAACACMAGFVCCESRNIGRVLNDLEKGGVGFLQSLKYGAAGFFFSSITPSSTGGQPMQLYYMHRDGIPLSHGTLSLALLGMGYQIGSMTFALLGLVDHAQLLQQQAPVTKTVLTIGISTSGALLALLIGVSFSRRLADGAEKLLLAFAEKMRRPQWRESIARQFLEYRRCSVLIRRRPGLLARNIATSLVQMALTFSVPYLVYRSLGCSGSSWLEIMSLQAVLSTGLAIVPIPGTAGAAEGGFQLIFRTVFPAAQLLPGMILSRSINIYASILMTGAVLAVLLLRDTVRRRTPQHPRIIQQATEEAES